LYDQAEKHGDAILGLKKIYVLYEISSSLIISLDANKNFFSIMNILNSRLETQKGSFIKLDKSGKKKVDELLFGFDEDDIKDRRYNINNDVIRNVAYTKDIVFLIHSETGIEAKGAQMTNFIDRELLLNICVPVLDGNENVTAILVVDRLFDNVTSLEKDIFFLRSIAAAISKNLRLKNEIESEKTVLSNENERLKKELRSNYRIGSIVSVSEEMAKVIEMVKQVSESGAPVLFTGETGTGKELLAKALHYNSKRVGSAFSKIHCGALPEALLSMEIFGNEADDLHSSQFPSKRGKLETCDGGTLYLEQIESMPLSVQGKLLRYLTDGEFEKEGGHNTIKVDTRIIVGTDKALEDLFEQGRFLPEFFYELSLINITLPELKKRKEDIPLLVKHFIKKHSKESSKKISDVSEEVLDKFMNYTWPGNVRELENCIKRMMIMATGKVLDESLLPNSIKDILENNMRKYSGGVESVIEDILKEKLEKIVSLFSMRSKKRKSVLYKRITDIIDKILIELSLRKCNNTQTDAASFLGINRNTLRTKIDKLKIDTNQIKDKDKPKSKRNLDLPFK
jgi:DNA-binding NtrC family response regulator